MVEGDLFPVGMRVLAVDDDQTCLKVLENLLRKCQYNVTTTNQSIKALEMLRRNRNKFDLVISDVNMPDMDGFKLLELVALEMDLPVIMLSGYSDKEKVMKGVIYGACDYLMKPVRIEELQNIWQHVLRRKIDSQDKNRTASEKNACNMAGEGCQAMAWKIFADQNKKLGQKMKEPSEVEEEEEDDQENEEPSNRKRRRLVWDDELHRKFVAAINQLGIDKAFPKKILDLMNVEGLTRENVASHLQKYRLGLKKPTQHANKVTTLGSSDPYLQMGSVEGFRTLSGSGGMLSTTLPSYASGVMLCRRNSPSDLHIRGINSSSLVGSVHFQKISSSSIKTLGNMQLSMFSANQTSSLLHGLSTPIEANQLQQNNCTTSVRKLSPLDDSGGFKASSGFSDCRAIVKNANNSLPGFANNHFLNNPPVYNSGAFRNHTPLRDASVNTQSFDPSICGSSNLLDYNLCNKNWNRASQISNFPANTCAVNKVLNNDHNFSSSTFSSGNRAVDFSSTSAINVPLEDSSGNLRCQEGLLENILPSSCYTQHQSWETDKDACKKGMTQTLNPINSIVSANGDTNSLGHDLDQNDTVCSKRVDATLVGQLKWINSSMTESGELEKLCSMKSSPEGLVQNSFGSFDDIMSEVVKQEQDAIMLMDGEMEFDAYHVGSCI
ncbi:hypothetical protein Fmac_012938 [Flemingia macrophylla]|uniref:Two-component response regulator n=1 Tax=Flemingia macrophylla TaxID=520843 RepID=A0ABD1MSJ7_9FABA